MSIDYIANLLDSHKICDDFIGWVIKVFFDNGNLNYTNISNHCETKAYQKYYTPIKKCAHLCQIIRPKSLAKDEESFYQAISFLEDSTKVSYMDGFYTNINFVESCLKLVSMEIMPDCLSFDNEEKDRINEAIHTYFESCYYSCVDMSVSAVESRLLKLMCIVNPASKQELDDKTLGQLITEFMQNKANYNNIVPNEHEPLLQLCNKYRIFSVHPKKESIKPTAASSILNLSLLFLMDLDTNPVSISSKFTST